MLTMYLVLLSMNLDTCIWLQREIERERLLNSTNIILNFENIIVFDVRQQYCAILCDDCVFNDVDTNKPLIT